MVNKMFLFCSIFVVILAACEPKKDSSEASSADKASKPRGLGVWKILATVNQRNISQKEFEIYKEIQPPENKLTDQELLQQLIDIELWSVEARKKQLDEDPENQLRLKVVSKQFYAEQAKQFLRQTQRVKQQQIEDAYEKRYSKENRRQVKLLRIKQNTQEEIEKILRFLKMGSNFIELRNLLSDLPADKIKAPDWQYISELPPLEHSAVSPLEVGMFTRKPVKTSDGWQLMMVQDMRLVEKPNFEQVKESLITDLKRQQIALRTEVLRNSSRINIVAMPMRKEP